MAYEPQVTYLRELLLSPNKQNAYGAALAVGNLTYRARFDGGLYAVISREFHSDIAQAGKGHPWPTVRNEISREITLGGSLELDDFLAGWLLAHMMKKVSTVGVGPYTHTFTFEQSTRQSPFTTVYFKDTADVFWRVQDLVMNQLQISGGERGPLTASFQMSGSGQRTEGSLAAPALPTPAYLYGSDTDILFGAPAAAASLDVARRRGWQLSLTDGSFHRRTPGGGLFGSQAVIGLQRAAVSFSVAAKDVDDIRTLFLGDTLQELQINTNSGAAAQLNIKIPNLRFRATAASEGNEVVWNVEAGEQDIAKGAGNLIEAVAINSQATYLVGA